MKVTTLAILAAGLGLWISETKAQNVLFDFDNAPLHSPLPIDLTVNGITAHFSGNPSYYNYSIQRADVLGFTPVGFAGYCIYPSTIDPCDLLISFSQALTFASILYAPEEYATDSSCRMRITAYLGATYVGTNTYTIPVPGTWPTGTLSITTTQPFDNVVIHYDAPPPTGGDYGPIFMADNLWITPVQAPTPLGAVSRKTHGTAGNFDVDLPLSGTPGIECRGGGATDDFQMVVIFGGPVAVNGTPQAQVTAGIGMIGSGGVTNGGIVTVSGSTVTVPLTNIVDAQTIDVTLFGVTVGSTAGNVVIRMSRLLGDINANGSVNATDVAQSKVHVGQAPDSIDFRADVNVSGGINAGDVAIVKSRIGTALP
jgi:hypothetical protein